MAKPNRAAMIKDEAKKSILLLPAVILLVCFFIVPIILTVYYSSIYKHGINRSQCAELPVRRH